MVAITALVQILIGSSARRISNGLFHTTTMPLSPGSVHQAFSGGVGREKVSLIPRFIIGLCIHLDPYNTPQKYWDKACCQLIPLNFRPVFELSLLVQSMPCVRPLGQLKVNKGVPGTGVGLLVFADSINPSGVVAVGHFPTTLCL